MPIASESRPLIIREPVGKDNTYTVLPDHLDSLFLENPYAFMIMKVLLSHSSSGDVPLSRHAENWVATAQYLEKKLGASDLTIRKAIRYLMSLGHLVEADRVMKDKRVKCYHAFSDPEEGKLYKLESEKKNDRAELPAEECEDRRMADNVPTEGAVAREGLEDVAPDSRIPSWESRDSRDCNDRPEVAKSGYITLPDYLGSDRHRRATLLEDEEAYWDVSQESGDSGSESHGRGDARDLERAVHRPHDGTSADGNLRVHRFAGLGDLMERILV